MKIYFFKIMVCVFLMSASSHAGFDFKHKTDHQKDLLLFIEKHGDNIMRFLKQYNTPSWDLKSTKAYMAKALDEWQLIYSEVSPLTESEKVFWCGVSAVNYITNEIGPQESRDEYVAKILEVMKGKVPKDKVPPCERWPLNPKEVSLIELIVNPKKYDKQLVRVIGVVSLGFESKFVYFTSEHYENRVSENAIRLDISSSLTTLKFDGSPSIKAFSDKYASANGKYALLEGRFNANCDEESGDCDSELEYLTRFGM